MLGQLVGGGDERGAGPLRIVSSGDDFGCGVHDDGSLECWGDDQAGQLAWPGGTFGKVATSWNAGMFEGGACALEPNHTATCWGTDNNHEREPPPDAFGPSPEAAATTAGFTSTARSRAGAATITISSTLPLRPSSCRDV